MQLQLVPVEKTSFLCKGAALPGQTIAEVPVPFRGRNLYIVVIENLIHGIQPSSMTLDFEIRNEIERWMNSINDLELNTGLNNVDDYTSDLIVEQLGRDNSSS